jgi:hypothetical protein
MPRYSVPFGASRGESMHVAACRGVSTPVAAVAVVPLRGQSRSVDACRRGRSGRASRGVSPRVEPCSGETLK